MEILGFIVIEIILSGIGWACLYIWHRDKKKVEKVKNEKYAGDFGAAGRVMILNLIAGVGAIVIFGTVIFFLGVFIYKSMRA